MLGSKSLGRTTKGQKKVNIGLKATFINIQVVHQAKNILREVDRSPEAPKLIVSFNFEKFLQKKPILPNFFGFFGKNSILA